MSYCFSRQVDGEFGAVVERVTAALKQRGFGVLSDIDVQATLKQKIGADFRPYRILGACNPPLALKALTAEADIGVMLPCNVVVQDAGAGKVRVSAIDPMAAMSAVDNPGLNAVAAEVAAMMKQVVEAI